MKRRLILPLLLLVLLLLAGGAWLIVKRSHHADRVLVLYGNIDSRDVDLAFNESERVATIDVREGDRVSPGQKIAALDTARLRPIEHVARATLAAREAIMRRDRNGTRPQEVSQARAALAAAKAQALYARQHLDRLRGIGAESHDRAVSREDLQEASAALAAADAKADQARKALELATLGPREEDISRDEAEMKAAAAQATLAKQHLDDAILVAPSAGIVRSRLLEPGDMASPQTPAVSIAIMDPKWVRVWIAETQLVRIHEGLRAQVMVDGLANRQFPGWVGFISPEAEFTPKAVQTPELRTSLVYEVRVFVHDPDNLLRLGMPATVSFAGP